MISSGALSMLFVILLGVATCERCAVPRTLFREMPLTGKVSESASTCARRCAAHTSTVATGDISADTDTANVRTPSCRDPHGPSLTYLEQYTLETHCFPKLTQ